MSLASSPGDDPRSAAEHATSEAVAEPPQSVALQPQPDGQVERANSSRPGDSTGLAVIPPRRG